MLKQIRAAGVLTLTAAAVAALLTGCSTKPITADGPATVKWSFWDIANYKDVVAGFEAKNPKIKIEATEQSYDDYLNVLRPSLTSKDGPDVFQVAPGALLTNYGPLADDLAPLAASEWGNDWTKNYSKVTVSQLSTGKKVVGLPNYVSGAGLMFYNDSLVKKLGITVPTTVPDLIKTCATVTAAGYECLSQGAKDSWVNSDVYIALANSIDSKKLYAAIDGKGSWTDPALVTAMTAWQSLFTKGVIPSGATALSQYPDANVAWLGNKAVFIAMGTWNTAYTELKAGLASQQKSVTSPIDGVFLSAPFPAAEAGGTPTKLFGGVANGWALNSSSKNKAAAFKFIAYLSGKGGQDLLGKKGVFPALLTASLDSSDVIDPQQAKDIERQQKSLSDIVGPRDIPYPDLATALGQALAEVAAGTATPKDALTAVQTASDAVKRG